MWLELLKLENRLENGTKLRTVVTLFNVIVFFLLLLFALYTMIEKSATRINARNKNEKKREEKKK